MKYVVIPIEEINKIPGEIMQEKCLVPRNNVPSTKVLIKDLHAQELFPEYLEKIIEVIDGVEQEVIHFNSPFPTYEGEALQELLNSPEWSVPVEE